MSEMNEVVTNIITHKGDKSSTYEDDNLWGRRMKYRQR